MAMNLLQEMDGVIRSDFFGAKGYHFTLYLYNTGNLYALKRYNYARSRNHCYRGKAINITYSESVLVVLRVPHAVS